MKLSDITFKNVQNFVEGNAVMLYDSIFDSLATHTKEQAIVRSKLCQPCTDAGKCTECGCKTPNMYYAPRKVCSKGRWGKMMDEGDWENFKTIMKKLDDTQVAGSDTDDTVEADKTKNNG